MPVRVCAVHLRTGKHNFQMHTTAIIKLTNLHIKPCSTLAQRQQMKEMPIAVKITFGSDVYQQQFCYCGFRFFGVCVISIFFISFLFVRYHSEGSRTQYKRQSSGKNAFQCIANDDVSCEIVIGRLQSF